MSVIIVTRNRPDMVGRCLDALKLHLPQPGEKVVVDASDNSTTRDLTAKYDDVRYIHFANGINQRPEAKNIGMRNTDGPLLVFLDDDSMVRDGWLTAMLKLYDDPEVGCVGGGVDEPGTEWNMREPIGRVLANGGLSQNFSPTHAENVEVDHVKGCNMSFRRELLEKVGGFDPGYIGDNLREESDACLSIKSLGKKVMFCPSAVVTHLRAPREGITRELGDPGKIYCYSRNHTYFIVKHFPRDARMLWKNFAVEVWDQVRFLRPNRQLPERLHLVWVTVLGKITGTAAALTSRRVWAAWRRSR
ncbi:MAG: glycosyltransferase family 2 protein [Armatimonadetes bacterium]|nr:glycosyltransferase family 2 protein [Armatimonadota bacterium]